MKQLFIVLLGIIISASHAWCQEKKLGRVKGQVKDKDSKQPLADATIALLCKKDSARVLLTQTDKQGYFLLNDIPEGNYTLYISYLGYQSLSYPLLITTDNNLVDLSLVSLQKTGLTMAVVEIVQSRPPVVLKKDTIEFNADYFKTRENALLEELLKKLPGVQITRDGTIKVQGETVKRILINGQSFFGNNPKLATRNLAAELIDKVQLIDGKPGQTALSDIQDGKTEKIINITIKKEHQHSFSGRTTVGYGTDERFLTNATLNRFSEQQQLSFLGSGNNTNGFPDGNGTARGGNGITRNWTAGVNYSENVSPKLLLSANYLFNNNHTKIWRNSTRQNILPDTSFDYDQHGNSTERNTEHTLFMRMDYKPDTMHILIAALNVNHRFHNNLWEQHYESSGSHQQLLNSGNLRNLSTGNDPKLSATISFTKKLKKSGRSFGLELSLDNNQEKETRFNSSHNLYMSPAGNTYTDTINQRNDINVDYRHILLYLNYAEPVFKGHILNLTYGYIWDNNVSDKLTYDYNTSKETYDRLNNSLSNSFENIITTQQTLITLRAQKKKYAYSIGGYLQLTQLNNNNINQRNHILLKTANVLPAITFNYAFTKNNRLRYSYYTNIQLPNVAQLQPVPDNSNPLYIHLGNPNLKPATVQNHSMDYKTFNPHTMRSFSMDIKVSFINNKIINACWFDSLGRQVSQPLNVNGAYNININMENAFPLKKLNTSVNATSQFLYNRDVNYTNGTKGNTNSFNAGQIISFNYAYKELLDFTVETGIHYNGVRYIVQNNNNTHFLNYTISFDANINLPLGIIIGSRLDYWLNTGRATGYNLNGALLNASISKSIFKHRRGLIKLHGFDLLKQNVSINRTVGQNYIEDVHSIVIQQFFMFSFSYFLKNAVE